jgi:hypothetical protein
MADFTQTVSNQMNMQPEEGSWWGSDTSISKNLIWGTGNWGSTKNTITDVGKWLSNALTGTSRVEKAADHHVVFGTMGMASAVNLGALTQGIWSHVLKGVTDPDDRVCPTWTEESDPTDGWTESTDPSTTWSEL